MDQVRVGTSSEIVSESLYICLNRQLVLVIAALVVMILHVIHQSLVLLYKLFSHQGIEGLLSVDNNHVYACYSDAC